MCNAADHGSIKTSRQKAARGGLPDLLQRALQIEHQNEADLGKQKGGPKMPKMHPRAQPRMMRICHVTRSEPQTPRMYESAATDGDECASQLHNMFGMSVQMSSSAQEGTPKAP